MKWINNVRDGFWFVVTIRARLRRQAAAIEYWMNEAMRLERQYEGVEPVFTVVEDVDGTYVPNSDEYLGEYPPLEVYQHEGPGL